MGRAAEAAAARLAPRKWPCGLRGQVRQRAARPRKAAPSDVLYLLSVRLRWAGGCSGRKLLRRKSSAPRKVPSKVHRIYAIVEHDEVNTLFIPIVLTSCGGLGPSAQKYLKHIYSRARENSCSDMGVGQPDIQTT